MQKYQLRKFQINFVLSILLIYGAGNLKAEEQLTYYQLDSLTYQYYLNGNWDKLIETGEKSLANDIDFKWLQQRLGYAWFMKKQYYRSMKHYEKSLQFDNSDEISHLYLYYIGLNTGNFSYARAHAAKLSEETQQQIKFKKSQIVNAVDFEYNLKIPQETELRDNAHYFRGGIHALPLENFSVYVSLARFNQLFEYTKESHQQEMYGAIQYSLTPSTSMKVAYQSINSQVYADPDTSRNTGNLFFGKINHQLNRFNLSLSYAYFKNLWTTSGQTGLQLGAAFSGDSKIYLSGSLYHINESGIDFNNKTYNYNRLIFKQTAGFSPMKYIRTEAFLTLGDQYCFADQDGLYLYNNQDPTKFKAGLTVYAYIGKHLTLNMTYNYDKKLIYLFDQYYYQHGITGGIVWKI